MSKLRSGYSWRDELVRQTNKDLGSDADLTLARDRTLMVFDDILDYGEPQAGAPCTSSPRLISSVETIEDVRQVLI